MPKPRIPKIVKNNLMGHRLIHLMELKKHMMRTTLNEPKIKKLETIIRACNNTLTKGKINSVSRKVIRQVIQSHKNEIEYLKRRFENVKRIDYYGSQGKKLGMNIDSYISEMTYVQTRIKKFEKELEELKKFLEEHS